MKDYRIPASVAIPAAIGIVGVLWLLRRKSDSSNKKEKASKITPEEGKHADYWSDRVELDQRTQLIEKDVTVSQRKVPETKARDRGGSDLKNQNHDDLPGVVRQKSLDLVPDKDKCDFIECGQGDCLGSSQRAYIDHVIATAMGDGWQEILAQLDSSSEVANPLDETSGEVSGNLSDAEQPIGSGPVEDGILFKSTCQNETLLGKLGNGQESDSLKIGESTCEKMSGDAQIEQECAVIVNSDTSNEIPSGTHTMHAYDNTSDNHDGGRSTETNSNDCLVVHGGVGSFTGRSTLITAEKQTEFASSLEQAALHSSQDRELIEFSQQHETLESSLGHEPLVSTEQAAIESSPEQTVNELLPVKATLESKLEQAGFSSSQNQVNLMSSEQAVLHSSQPILESPFEQALLYSPLEHATVGSLQMQTSLVPSQEQSALESLSEQAVLQSCKEQVTMLKHNAVCPELECSDLPAVSYNQAVIESNPSRNNILEPVEHNKQDCSLNTNESELATKITNQLTTYNSDQSLHKTSDSADIDNGSDKRCDWSMGGIPADSWIAKISSASNDGLEEIDSVWSIESTLETTLDSGLPAGNAQSSFSGTDNSYVVNSQVDVPPENVAVSFGGICNLDFENVALTSKSGKDDSPAKSNSPACDSNSEGSNDSGRGGSEHDMAYQASEALVHFDFNMPSELCGRLIGKNGKNINYLRSKTGAHVSLTNNPYTPDYQICQVVGSQAEVDDALAMIRRKFPLQNHPMLTMVPINASPPPVVYPEQQLVIPDVMQLSLPEGVSVDVFVSAIVDAGHIFVQQPTHRSFMSLEKMNYFLSIVYGQDPNVPCVPMPVECGTICICENDGYWYRAMIMAPEDENGDVQVKFMDYGGYMMMPASSLKQIRADFMTLPFQAVECFMANVTPNQNEQFFSEEATQALSEMTQGKLLQCQVVARTENGIPYIHLYQISMESNSAVLINRALVNSHLVRWIEIL